MVLVPNGTAVAPYNSAVPTGVIIYAHGVGEDQTGLVTDALKAGCMTALIDAGYIMAGTNASGDNFGSQSACNNYVALAAYLRATYNVSYIAIWSQSMGGLAGLMAIAQNNIAGIVGWLGTYPLCSLNAAYTGSGGTNFSSSVNAAFGITGTAPNTYGQLTNYHDPLLRPQAAYRNIPMRYYASWGDTAVGKTQNTDAFSAMIGASARENTVVVCTGNHGDPSHFVPSEYVAFFGRCFASVIATAIPPTHKTLGAISFPWHQAPATTGRSRDGEIQILGPAAAHPLLPYFGTVTGSNSVTADNTGQAAMDKMLAMCIAGGMDYISFDYYADALGYLAPSGGIQVWEGINNSLQLYLSSPLRSQIKFTLMLVGDDLGVAWPPVPADWPAVQADILTYLVRPEYQRIPDGRPLVYIFDAAFFDTLMGGTGTAKFNALRTACTTAGLPGTGVCLIDMNNNNGSNSLGADATSAYFTYPGGSGTAIPHSTLAAQAASLWSAAAAASRYYVPLCTLGYDIRPRNVTQFWDAKLGTGIGRGAVETTPNDYVDGTVTTASDIANHIKAGFDNVAANPTFAGSIGTVHVYALDEWTECGNGLLPCAQHGAADPYLQVLARTLQRQKDNPMALKARGMPIVNRPDRARSLY